MAFDRVLDLRGVLMDLLADDRVKQEEINVLLGATRTREQAIMHPLVYVASQNLEDLARPGRTLDGDALTVRVQIKHAVLPSYEKSPI